MNNHRSGKLFKLFLRNRKKNIARCRAKLLYINWKVEVIKEFSIHNFISMSPSIFFSTFWVLDGRHRNRHDGPWMRLAKWAVPMIIWMTGMWMVSIVVMALAMGAEL